MLCSRSASLITSTRRSRPPATIIFRSVSASASVAEADLVQLGDAVDEVRDLEAEVLLGARRACSRCPRSVSCSSAAASVVVSSPRLARIIATASGWVMNGSPDLRRWPRCCSSATAYARSRVGTSASGCCCTCTLTSGGSAPPAAGSWRPAPTQPPSIPRTRRCRRKVPVRHRRGPARPDAAPAAGGRLARRRQPGGRGGPRRRSRGGGARVAAGSGRGGRRRPPGDGAARRTGGRVAAGLSPGCRRRSRRRGGGRSGWRQSGADGGTGAAGELAGRARRGRGTGGASGGPGGGGGRWAGRPRGGRWGLVAGVARVAARWDGVGQRRCGARDGRRRRGDRPRRTRRLGGVRRRRFPAHRQLPHGVAAPAPSVSPAGAPSTKTGRPSGTVADRRGRPDRGHHAPGRTRPAPPTRATLASRSTATVRSRSVGTPAPSRRTRARCGSTASAPVRTDTSRSTSTAR